MTARLAVVDDDPIFTEYLQTFLRARGYSVETYNSGPALLDALRAGKGLQAILLDVTMPDLDGLQTLRAIRQAQPSAQVIMLSGKQTPATIVEAVRLGAADYVLKPGDPDGIGETALEAAIRNALEREALTAEVARLSAQMSEEPDGAQACWTSGAAMQPVLTMVERVASSDVSVLLQGESGVGKEVIARELHRRSGRRGKPFIKVNCAALPTELLESELFGHERGAFTGAGTVRVGKFEFANQGTILLDEVAEMPSPLQAKLLHVLQDQEVTRLGSNRPIAVNVRVIAATNRDLQEALQSGSFREDLYYRLQVIEIRIPPLRERREEIPALTEFFLAKYTQVYRRPPVKPSRMVLDALAAYQWPGNVRELENMMKRFVVLQDESLILAELSRGRPHVVVPAPANRAANAAVPVPTPPPAMVAPPLNSRVAETTAAGATSSGVHAGHENGDADDSESGVDLQALAKTAALHAERQAIDQALSRFRWNRRKAAQYLNVSYKTLLNKMKECGISESESAS